MFNYLILTSIVEQVPYGLAVRIPGFHPGGPGSTPGMGTACYFLFPIALRPFFPSTVSSFTVK